MSGLGHMDDREIPRTINDQTYAVASGTSVGLFFAGVFAGLISGQKGPSLGRDEALSLLSDYMVAFARNDRTETS